tara:strand:- start:74 stop:583 length:510 start_codon:yes stop_codon:yes gene_type:complete
MEIWKDIKGYEGYYKVSNLGRVKAVERIVLLRSGIYPVILKEKILKPAKDGFGYLIVSLSKNNIRKTNKIHHLVTIQFLNHIKCGFELVVDHIDGNKLNNNLENLQIITQRENSSKKITKSKYGTGVTFDKRNNRFMSRIHINGIREYLGSFKTEIEANNAYINKLKSI